MSVLIQDGRRGGHLKWATEAITAGHAGGVIISPFHTPRVAVPRHKSGAMVVAAVSDAGGEALLDATTHGRLLPGTDDLTHYDTWQLWGPAGVGIWSAPTIDAARKMVYVSTGNLKSAQRRSPPQ